MVVEKIESWKNFKFLKMGSWLVLLLIFFATNIAYAKIPGLNVDLSELDSLENITPAIKIVFLLTVLTVAPSILLMMTSFTRILIVLGFIRQALGTQSMPPNQVIIGLAMFLTFFSMGPVWKVINENSVKPYVEKKIDDQEAIDRFVKPVKKFMFLETRSDDLGLFFELSKTQRPNTQNEIPMTLLMPAFLISELKTAFEMGFLVYIPFLIIDMVVSSILMSIGMMMLPPTVVSLPFKIVLFVLVDGWSLVVSSLMRSFQSFVP